MTNGLLYNGKGLQLCIPLTRVSFVSPLLQFRRYRQSTVNNLRTFLLKKLHSFNTPSSPIITSSTSVLPQSQPSEIIEAGSSVVIEEMETAHVILSENTDGLDAAPPSSSSETLEELVDQMEIEISDREGEEGSSAEERGAGSEEEVEEVTVSSGGVATRGEEMVVSEKIERSTRIGTGGPGVIASRGAEVIEGVMSSSSGGRVREEGSVSSLGSRRRKYSSTHDKAEFPVISLKRQLTNEDIMELVGVLQVGVMYKQTYMCKIMRTLWSWWGCCR